MLEIKAGRPKEENPRDIKVTVRFTKEENERVDELAKKMGMTKARLMRNLALGGLEDAEFLQKVGILPLVKNLIDFRDKLKGI
uniref:plasmid mobilization protein n=1 Tax=Aliarcobacter sp. TaxID=2321116 RepID=UPI004047AED5